ncbi:phytanoyl-CoA dioxygenase family protein [Paraurantiacibacter namhicola]|nr:phytanoyl-CoA dioxygenase family protein [Paraurantiacibacter namhicola]
MRLTSHSDIAGWLKPISNRLLAFGAKDFRPVRAVLFDKSANTNWALGWHQDRTINVEEQRPVEGFGPWSRKAGVLHVEPPFEIIERMLTLRIHFDDTPKANAPLVVACGSHRLGKIASGHANVVAEACPAIECVASRGDVWLYATSILHSSKRASRPDRRRVLQVDFSADKLPGGLKWLGLA